MAQYPITHNYGAVWMGFKSKWSCFKCKRNYWVFMCKYVSNTVGCWRCDFKYQIKRDQTSTESKRSEVKYGLKPFLIPEMFPVWLNNMKKVEEPSKACGEMVKRGQIWKRSWKKIQWWNVPMLCGYVPWRLLNAFEDRLICEECKQFCFHFQSKFSSLGIRKSFKCISNADYN